MDHSPGSRNAERQAVPMSDDQSTVPVAISVPSGARPDGQPTIRTAVYEVPAALLADVLELLDLHRKAAPL